MISIKEKDMTSSAELIFEQIEVGAMENFSYVIGDAKTREVALVDPAWEIDKLCKRSKKNGYKIIAALLTHGHFDHTQGVDELLSHYDIPIYISKHETSFYFPDCKNLHKTENGEKLKLGSIEIECLHTPGHASGCQCYKCGDILLTGDTLFIDGCGRCDLPGGDPNAMYQSLFDVIMKLPDSTVIYPGHNYGSVPYATLAQQKKSNPYLQSKNSQDFLQRRMGIMS